MHDIKISKSIIDNRNKPNMQWTDLIYPILLTYNNKSSFIERTPHEARKPANGLTTYMNMKLKAKEHISIS